MKPPRGLTLVTVLIVLAVAGGIYWLIGFGPAYWDNTEVKAILNQAANLCYHEQSDDVVRDFVFKKLHDKFDRRVLDHGRYVTELGIDLKRDDMQIERSQVPPRVDIWLTYSRTVKLPLVAMERVVTFNDHVDQDLSPVKW